MNLNAHSALILRSRALRGVSKDGVGYCIAWFETRCFAALLTMRDARNGAIRHSPFTIRHSPFAR
jgi:hypothetical protein